MAEEVNMDDINQVWDRILHIKTTGRDDSISDFTRYPYEPTDIIRYLPVCVNAGI